jgi:ADP-ribosyl-[dinitrogen reductase] hydrolase
MDDRRIEAAFQGVLLGTAVGDALGLPFEGMSRRRVHKLLAGRPLSHRFLLGRGMVSDDTDHACMTAVALAEVGSSPEAFARSLARQLRFWLLTLPAGIGFGTLRGIMKLWLGFSPERSGVYSAGNGPCMRAPVLGVFARDDVALRRGLVRASTRVTHVDPRAEEGARAVAAAAAAATRAADFDPSALLEQVLREVDDPDLAARLEVVGGSLDEPTEAVVVRWNQERGISGFVYDTVPAVLHAWLRSRGDFAPVVTELIRCGGDTDTTAAIAGALAGAARGPSTIPPDWLHHLLEWPRSVPWMTHLGTALATGRPSPGYFRIALPARNFVFLMAVYAHIFRRALPPY